MNDRELLESAAKAVGIVDYEVVENSNGDVALQGKSWALWEPLTDDGDALRLLVRLYPRGVVLDAGGGGICLDIGNAYVDEWNPLEGSYDPYAATRRAVVRAAAELGKERK